MVTDHLVSELVTLVTHSTQKLQKQQRLQSKHIQLELAQLPLPQIDSPKKESPAIPQPQPPLLPKQKLPQQQVDQALEVTVGVVINPLKLVVTSIEALHTSKDGLELSIQKVDAKVSTKGSENDWHVTVGANLELTTTGTVCKSFLFLFPPLPFGVFFRTFVL